MTDSMGRTSAGSLRRLADEAGRACVHKISVRRSKAAKMCARSGLSHAEFARSIGVAKGTLCVEFKEHTESPRIRSDLSTRRVQCTRPVRTLSAIAPRGVLFALADTAILRVGQL